ncbi:hypothetical protein [Methanobrevibacter sp.]
MKLKKSYLLIAIAIFLLISIGSVCASENITDGSDVQLADDGTDVVLSNSDTEENVADDTQIEKINTTVETDKDKYEFKQDTNKSFTVEVKDKDNESNKINVNKSDLSVLNGNKNVSFEYTGSIMTITEALPVGNYNLTINYIGNENFINSTKVIGVKVYGNNTIETVTSVVCNGKNIEIPVKVYDGVEYIELNKTNFNLTLVYTNETGNISNLTIYDKDFIIDNGTIKFNTTVKLIAASVIIGYTNAEPKTVNIKVSTEVKANADKDKFKSEENKTISITILNGEDQLNVVKNDLKVFENGNEITNFKYNNSKITIELDIGVHNLTIVYKGNETYNSSNTTVTLNVYGNNTINVPESVVSDGNTVEVPVTLFDGVENITLTKEFNMTLTYTNKSGNKVTVNLTNDDYEITADGKIKFNVENYEWIQASININYVNSTGSKDVKILLNSSVQATPDKTKYGENETNNITVKVKGNEGNELNITKNDLKVYDNGVEITDFTFTNGTLNVNLNIGVHNLTIVYVGNATYTTSNVSIEQKVNGSLRFNPDETVVLNQNKDVIITINLNDGADFIDDIDSAKLTVELLYSVNGGNYSRTINISDITINGQNISFKVNEVFDSASAYIKYDNLNATTNIKVNTSIEASDIEYGESEVKDITVTVVGDNGYNINITKDNIQVINNKDGKALTIEVNGSVITIKDVLKFGLYNLTIKYLGTDTFLASDKNITLTVYGINATNKTDINSTKKGEVEINIVNGNSNVTVTGDDLTLTVTYKDGNETKNITVSNVELNNGTLTFTLENGNFTTATLTIKYRNTTSNVTLNRIYNFKAIPQTADADYQEGNFTFLIVDIDDNDKPLVNKSVSISGVNSAGTTLNWIIILGENSFTFNQKTELKTDENGIVTLNNKGFSPGIVLGDNVYSPAGDYNMTISGAGNLKGSHKTVITINKINLKITLEPFSEYYGSDKKFTIVVTNAKSGKVISGVSVNFEVSVDGEIREYTSKDADGKTVKITSLTTNSDGKIELPTNNLMSGTYTIKTNVNNTENYNAASNQDTAEIKKIPVTITAKDKTIYYNSGTSSTITVKDKNGKAVANMYVLVIIDGNTKTPYLFQTNSKGQISFSASLAVGKHKVAVASADNRYDAKQVTQTITVKQASAKITTKKVTTYYKGGKTLDVKLTNTKTKTAIYDGKINIKIFISKNRYYNYNGNTGMNGKLKLLLDTLKPGKYKVVISGADNKNFKAKEVTTKIVIKKAPAKIKAKKLTAKKGAKKYFTIKVTNKKTKKAIPKVKVKVKVYTGKKAKTYKIKTNSKGIAKLSVKKLKFGKHKVVITSANKYVTAKKAKSTIKIKK